MKLLTIATVFFVTNLFLQSHAALAEDVNLGGKIPSVDEVIQGLQGSPEDDAPMKTRGINLHPTGATAPLAAREKAISMEIRFAFDSAELTEEAVRQLTPVVDALKSEKLSGLKFLVEGHTDAKGSDEYNQSLSVHRALSVRDFIEKRGLDASRIQYVGRGKNMLLDSSDPYGGVNRRVRIVAVP